MNNRMTNFTKLTCQQFTPQPKPIKADKPKKVKIKPMSDKRKADNKIYLTLREVFLKDKKCQVKGCNNIATTVHHKKGRIGELLCDIKFWLACCMECHSQIENFPEWAYENNYSLLRNTKDGADETIS